jgi:Leucine-rich repeat (LRR) protein
VANLRICLSNQQEAYSTLDLNEALHLQYYGFANIDCLESFPKVHSLYLNNNLIEQIAGLASLSNLCTLNLSHNRISALEGLSQLSLLYTLDITHNQLKALPSEELKPLKMLHTLKAVSNRFANHADIAGIAEVAQSLAYLDLSNN